MKPNLIINGDDFGLSAEANACIIAAHGAGVLTSTSLMMGGDAVQEAVELARQYPTLAVGLHVSFSDTKPVLHPEQVPLLVMANGYFPPDDGMHRAALRSREGRHQLRNEIEAQFRAYAMTKLAWDHVNGHRHFHRSPPLAMMLFQEAATWPVKATRIPYDPPIDAVRYLRTVGLWQLAKFYGLAVPDRSIGRDWNVPHLVEVLAALPAGTSELYFHPGNRLYQDDLPILLDNAVKAALSKVTLGDYRMMTP